MQPTRGIERERERKKQTEKDKWLVLVCSEDKLNEKKKFVSNTRITYNIFCVHMHKQKHDCCSPDTFSPTKSLLFDFYWFYSLFFSLCITKRENFFFSFHLWLIFGWLRLFRLFIHIFDGNFFVLTNCKYFLFRVCGYCSSWKS